MESCILGKGLVHPRTDHEGVDGKYSYNSTLSFTWESDEVACSTPRPGFFSPGKKTR